MSGSRIQFIGDRWVHPSPAATEHNWFNVTTWADRDWKAAQAEYWRRMSEAKHNPEAVDFAQRYIKSEREVYRHRVLSWYRKLCLPIQIGECVPSEVALLIAEEWDETTKHPAVSE